MEDSQRVVNTDVIGGRYRLEAELGRGGMARVVRAHDERTGQHYALKQLIASGERAATLRAMFEREYHTLATLAHPHIVRVFDYGFDVDGSPYYTMELLEGIDARESVRQGALDVQRACLILRDTASALALIHARRFVHRDVGPRNVWCTPNGGAKLIDFGTLVAMGAEARIAGTPPFLPPEAFYAQPLDARCDLYALGALGYFLLTQRNAYPARVLADLPELWQRRPPRPDALRPELPQALSDLIMSLLSLDARGRPSSASEVYDRLSAIAGLPVEHEAHIAQAFLSSPTLVGRSLAQAAFAKRLRKAVRGRGSSLALVAPAGMGRSRMLSTLVLDAKLVGASTVLVGASAVGSEPLALASAIAERLLEQQPSAAGLVAEVAGTLGHVSSALHKALGAPALAPLAPAERARTIPNAIVKLVDLVSRQHKVVIAVDDLHRADSASLWVLGRVSLLARDHRLLLVTSCDEAALSGAPPALAQLVAPRRRVPLPPLSAADTRALLESLFEDVPELDSVASWLHELAQGSPQACMQYAQYLVDQGVARYEGGSWRLPRELKAKGLPSSLGALLERRVSGLSPDARMLALGLALARDPSRAVWQPEVHVPMELFPKLLDTNEGARAFVALDELLRASLVQERNGFYVLGQTAAVDALVRASDLAEQRRMHGRIADVFAAANTLATWLIVRHMLLADQIGRALERTIAWAREYQSALADFGSMRLSLMAECGVRMLEEWKMSGESARDGILLRRCVLLICSVFDWQLSRFGTAQVEQLARDCGLSHWASLHDLPPAQRVAECLRRAETAHRELPEQQRGLAPSEALTELASCALQLTGSYANSHEVEAARALQRRIEPLVAYSPLLGLLGELSQLACERVSGLEIYDRVADVGVTRMMATPGMPDVLRQGSAGVHIQIQTVEDARRGRDRGFALMDLLASVIGDEMFIVVHGRWLCHAFRGNAAEAKRLYQRVELITEDDVWRRRAFLFAEAELHALTGDLRSLTRVTEALRELAGKFPGWRAWSEWARAEQLRLQGDFAAAQTEVDRALGHCHAGDHRAWGRLATSRASLALLRGDAAAALRAANAIIATVKSQRLDLSVEIEAERIAALSHSKLGDHAAAQAALERAFTRATQIFFGGLPLGRLHETAARLALSRQDIPACVEQLAKLWTFMEHAEAPSFITAYETLREECSRSLQLELPRAKGSGQTDWSEHVTLLSEVQTRLSALSEPPLRAQHALELLLEDCGCVAGYLFLIKDGKPHQVAANAAVGGEDVLAVATQFLSMQHAEIKTVTATEAGSELFGTQFLRVPSRNVELVPVLLSERGDDSLALVGVALLVVDAQHALNKPPRADLVRLITACLRAAGDSEPLVLDT